MIKWWELIAIPVGYFVLGLLVCHNFAHAGERPTLGKCLAASAVAGAHNYEWQEKRFTREDCEAISAPTPKAPEPAEIDLSQKPDPVEIHIHNPAPPAPVIIQKPAPTINIHIHNEGAPGSFGPQSTLSDAPATNLKHTAKSDVRPDLFLLPPTDKHIHTPPNDNNPPQGYHWMEPGYQYGPGFWSNYSDGQSFFHNSSQCDPYYGAGCGY